jgi:hypothetical protein
MRDNLFSAADKVVGGTLLFVVSTLLTILPFVGNAETSFPMVVYADDQGEAMQEADVAGKAWEVIGIEDVYYMKDKREPLVPSVTLKKMANVVVGATTFNYGETKYSLEEFKAELLKGSFTN